MSFVPAKKVYLSIDEISEIKVNDEVNIDSGLGGSYTMKVTSIDEEFFYLECFMKDHEHKSQTMITNANKEFFNLKAA